MVSLLVALLMTQADTALAHFDAGRAAARAEDWPLAMESFERATALFPTWGLAQLELAEARMRAGAEPAKTEEALAAARRLEPNNPRAFASSAAWYEAQGDVEAALGAFQKALELRPDLLDCRERLGLLLSSAGRAAEAVPHLAAVLDARPDARAIRANLADALEQAGDASGAEVQLKRLVRENPQSVAFRRRLALFYERLGEERKAKAEWSRIGAPPKRPAMRPLLPSKR